MKPQRITTTKYSSISCPTRPIKNIPPCSVLAGTKSDGRDLMSDAMRLNHFSFVTGIASRKVCIGVFLKHHLNRSPAAAPGGS
jgi:hypothetical protein